MLIYNHRMSQIPAYAATDILCKVDAGTAILIKGLVFYVSKTVTTAGFTFCLFRVPLLDDSRSIPPEIKEEARVFMSSLP